MADEIETGELRKWAGLAVHVTEVYSDGRSYLKGVFNAIEVFHWDQDLEGWRLRQAMDNAALFETDEAAATVVVTVYPLVTRISDEMKMHIYALRVLFGEEVPHTVPIQPTEVGKIRYFIGDASAEGFGPGTQYPDLNFEGRDG